MSVSVWIYVRQAARERKDLPATASLDSFVLVSAEPSTEQPVC